jgi:hypothetical protein
MPNPITLIKAYGNLLSRLSRKHGGRPRKISKFINPLCTKNINVKISLTK